MKIVCVGRNYAKHINELNNKKPDEPVLFIKPDTAVLPYRNPLVLPDFAKDFHYEVELVVKINKLGKHIEPKFAQRYYDEIGLGLDITARDLQTRLKAGGLPWEKAKAFDNSAVVSREFLPKTGFNDLQNIHFSLQKNGVTVQQGHTADMLWQIDELISYISRFFTLKKGDLIFTGTPAGVGKIQINDILTGYIENREMFRVKIK